MIILTDNKNITVSAKPTVVFNNEMEIFNVKVPIKTEIDFSKIHPSQHEFILDLAIKMYHKNIKVG